MFTCDAVDLDYLDKAPLRLDASINVDRPPSEVFAALAHDPANWGEFFPGFAKTGGKRSLANFDICPFVPISLHDDVEQARLPVKQHLAFYVGGMGAREKNFYNDYAKRLGYGTAAAQIQDAFLAGRRKEAVAAVPDELVDEVALTGPASRICARLETWKAAGAQRHMDTILLGTNVTSKALQVVATAADSP